MATDIKYQFETLMTKADKYEKHNSVVKSAKRTYLNKIFNDPEKYRAYLDKRKQYSKAYRDRKRAQKQPQLPSKIVIDEEPANV